MLVTSATRRLAALRALREYTTKFEGSRASYSTRGSTSPELRFGVDSYSCVYPCVLECVSSGNRGQEASLSKLRWKGKEN